jgi:hypothetical protein
MNRREILQIVVDKSSIRFNKDDVRADKNEIYLKQHGVRILPVSPRSEQEGGTSCLSTTVNFLVP